MSLYEICFFIVLVAMAGFLLSGFLGWNAPSCSARERVCISILNFSGGAAIGACIVGIIAVLVEVAT